MTKKDTDGASEAQGPIETVKAQVEAALAKRQEAAPDIESIAEMVVIPPDPELRLAPLYAALAKAQGAFPEIPKGRTATIRPQTGESWAYKYSDLSDLIKAVRKPLADNGLGFYQHPTEDGKSLATVVFHSTGLAITTLYPMHQTTGGRMHPAQNYSVGGTYAKRNGLSDALGVASEETVERNQSDKTTPDFDDSSGDGVLTVRGVVVPDGATKADKAKIYGEGIESQMGEAKSQTALDGVWKRNEGVIDALQDHFRDDYENVLSSYGEAQARFFGERAASSMAPGGGGGSVASGGPL